MTIFKDKLYIFGGKASDDEFAESLTSVEIFDFTLGSWSEGPEMPVGLSTGACCIFNDDIYILGGLLKRKAYSRKIWKLESDNNKWE